MTYSESTKIYSSDEGKLFVHRFSKKVFGRKLRLGRNDRIENYEEKEFAVEEIEKMDAEHGAGRPTRPVRDGRGRARRTTE